MDKSFPASLDQLGEMLKYIREQAKKTGFREPLLSEIELASEEALVNIISYGYPEERGNIEISCIQSDGEKLKIVILDHGIPFNPLTLAKKYDLLGSAELMALGGLGINFILKLMDEVSYLRENNSNIMTLIKFLKKGADK